MKILASIVCFFLLSCGSESTYTFSEYASKTYPSHPESQVTPGSLCKKTTRKRHPEQVNYCKRDVSKSRKEAVIETYDRDFGYSITSQNRSQFKIDHYIPLGIGGSNEKDNLWPQHKTFFSRTDIIEQRLFDLMTAGKIKQIEAVQIIKDVKFDTTTAEKVREELEARF